MQTVSSMQTSVNTRKLPSVWGKLNYRFLQNHMQEGCLTVVDYGSGRVATSDKVFLFLKYHPDLLGVQYWPYDPYWGDIDRNRNAISCLCQWEEADLCVCANVLNVIDDLSTINEIIQQVVKAKYWVFQIYEGDKTRQGKYTKNHTCYQRNESVQDYQKLIEIITGGKTYRRENLITNCVEILK